MLKKFPKPDTGFYFVVLWYVFLIIPFFGHINVTLGRLFNINVGNFGFIGFSALYVQIFVLLVVCFLFFSFYARGGFYKKDFKITSLLYKTIPVTIVFILIQNYLISLDTKYYPNFLYSHTGFAPEDLRFTNFISKLFIVLSFFFLTYSYSSSIQHFRLYIPMRMLKNANFDRFVFAISIATLIVFAYFSSLTFIGYRAIFLDSSKSYDYVLGSQYKYIASLKNYTPQDATIIHPPQGNNWPAIGNQVVLRYFLFPRLLVSGALINSSEDVKRIEGAFFVLVDPGTKKEWPILENDQIKFDERNFVSYKSLKMISNNNNIEVYYITF